MEEKVSNNISHNKGNIVIHRELLNDYIKSFDDENPLFRDFVPVKIDYDFLSDKLKICGYSKHFRAIFEGEVIPDYEVIISRSVKTENIVKARFMEIR